MGNRYNLGPFRVRPCGVYNIEKEYRYLDTVLYKGNSYVCKNMDTIDGVACIGIAPTGQPQSEAYWEILCERGEKGDLSDQYQGFLTIEDGEWDYEDTDKIFIPSTGASTLNIANPYNGCCGLIITKLELDLPSNSIYKADFNYIELEFSGDMYMYTFTYGNFGSGNKFVWSRSIIHES